MALSTSFTMSLKHFKVTASSCVGKRLFVDAKFSPLKVPENVVDDVPPGPPCALHAPPPHTFNLLSALPLHSQIFGLVHFLPLLEVLT